MRQVKQDWGNETDVNTNRANRQIAIVGAGLIGRAWALAFARGGCDVKLFDPSAGVAEGALPLIAETAEQMFGLDLLNGNSVSTITARVSASSTLGDAVKDVDYVQENSPERPDVKKSLFSELDELVPAHAVIASSTSAILPSVFTAHVKHRDRCLVVHPLNPPHLIPAVEVVPAPWTSQQTLSIAKELMLAIGQRPIMMTREIDGFLMNRLQGAVLDECFRLVDQGLASVEDIDISIRDGLALRWSFIGPFETADLNAPGGIEDYVERYQPGFANQFKTQTTRVDWAGSVLKKVVEERRAKYPVDEIAARQRWRDARLMSLAAYKRRAAKELGD
jgi:L-gulonate 3-dehydrogenase